MQKNGGRKSPKLFMDEAEMLMNSCDFYLKEAEKLSLKLSMQTTESGKRECLKELQSLKSKISFEIKQISKFLDENGDF